MKLFLDEILEPFNDLFLLCIQKIADFGLATQLTVPDEKHFTMCGTPNYISPYVINKIYNGYKSSLIFLHVSMK